MTNHFVLVVGGDSSVIASHYRVNDPAYGNQKMLDYFTTHGYSLLVLRLYHPTYAAWSPCYYS